MKLRDFLRLVDGCFEVVIWEVEAKDGDEPMFEGRHYNVPWWIAEYQIADPEKNDGDETIRIVQTPEGKVMVVIIVDC